MTDRKAFRPVATTLNIIQTVKRFYGAKLQLHGSYFDKVLGTSTVREAMERGDTVGQIVARFDPDLAAFARLREPFLMYR